MSHSLNNTCQWMSPQDLPQRKDWNQPHFDVFTHFGVWSSGRNSTIFKIGNSPSVGNQTVCALKGTPSSKDLPRVSTLLHNIRAAVPDDAFLGDVIQVVLDSDDNFYLEFFVDDNHLLCFLRTEDVVPRVCVPTQCKGAVLRAAHSDSLLAGHLGIDHTTVCITHSFYWPGFYDDVVHFVRSCRTCAASKGRNHQQLGIPQFSAIPVQPFTSYTIDMIGPLPTTKLGNNRIVTWADQTTKTIVTAVAAPPTSKETLTRLTFREICCHFGLLLNLTMDNNVRFNNGLWKSLWKMCGSKLKFHMTAAQASLGHLLAKRI